MAAQGIGPVIYGSIGIKQYAVARFLFLFRFLRNTGICSWLNYLAYSGESILGSSYTRLLPSCQVLPEKLFSQVPIQILNFFRREDRATRYTLYSLDWPTSGMLYPRENVFPAYGKVSAG